MTGSGRGSGGRRGQAQALAAYNVTSYQGLPSSVCIAVGPRQQAVEKAFLCAS